MSLSKPRQERLVVLTILGGLALNYPLLALFSRAELFLGIPVLLFYLFGFWLIFILLMAAILRRKGGEKP
ncbi:MAG: hypothetical protein HQM03_04480 [Magnetococcales bacterium]|nr:hypothetical protein [Magnetococcales bacterium]